MFAINILTLEKHFHNISHIRKCIQFAQHSEQREGRGMEEKWPFEWQSTYVELTQAALSDLYVKTK